MSMAVVSVGWFCYRVYRAQYREISFLTCGVHVVLSFAHCECLRSLRELLGAGVAWFPGAVRPSPAAKASKQVTHPKIPLKYNAGNPRQISPHELRVFVTQIHTKLKQFPFNVEHAITFDYEWQSWFQLSSLCAFEHFGV